MAGNPYDAYDQPSGDISTASDNPYNQFSQPKVIESPFGDIDAEIELAKKYNPALNSPWVAHPKTEDVGSVLGTIAKEYPAMIAGQAATQPFIPIPSAEVKPTDNPIVATGKEAYNLIKGIPEFLESPAGAATGEAALLTKPALIAGGFGIGFLNDLGQKVKSAYHDWDKLSTVQKAEAIRDMYTSGFFAALGLHGATAWRAKPTTVEREVPNATTIREQPESTGAELPRVPPRQNIPAHAEEVRQGAGTGATGGSGAQPSPEVQARAAAQPSVQPGVSPEIQQFSDIVTGKTTGPKVDTHLAVQYGLNAQNVSDLDALAKLRTDTTSQRDQLKAAYEAETDPAKKQALLNQRFATVNNAQIPREAIEVATNTGSHVEGEGSIPANHGDRPLDWRTHPEVADWLKKNGEALGIKLPDQLAKTERAELGSSQEPLGLLRKSVQNPRLRNMPEEAFDAEYKNARKAVNDAESLIDKFGIDNLTAQQRRTIGSAQDRWESASLERFRRNVKDIVPEDLFYELRKYASNAVKFGRDSTDYQKSIIILNELKRQGASPEQMLSGIKLASPDAAEIFKYDLQDIKKLTSPEFVGMGAAAAKGEPELPQLAQLTDSIRSLAAKDPSTSRIPEVFDMGKAAQAGSDQVSSALNGLKAVGKYLKVKLTGYPVWNDFKGLIGDRHLALSESAQTAREFVKQAEKSIPDKDTQAAISNYIDTGGDEGLLRQAEAETKDRYKAGYRKAANLTPEEKTVAENAKNYFASRLEDARQAGILEDSVEDYIHRMYVAESPFKQAIMNELRSGIFTGKPSLAKQRVFQYDFEAEKAGLKPVKSFIKRVAAYDLSLNKAIADRQAVRAMAQVRMPDGRPMVDIAGMGKRIEGGPDKGDATLIKPSFRSKDQENPINNRNDYVSRDYTPLKRWKWVTSDGLGDPIFVQGDVIIHPDAVKQVDALFKRSALRQHAITRAALGVGSTVKQTMLDLSGFHPVQIAVHAMEHRTFAPVGRIDFANPDVRGLIRGGLVVGETTGRQHFDEGLAGSSLTKYIPYVGDKMNAYKEWLFNDYIPRLKTATGLHALERNRARFPKLSQDELYHLTANEMNAAFGELNYEMLGRSKTTQDMMRLALFAPDFLEARARFTAQAATKYGREQFQALALGALTLYITARIINKLTDGAYHFEPENAFSVIHNKRAYSLRTVQGDLLHLIEEPGQFMYTRLNPVFGRTLMEFFSKRDYYGRRRNALQQLKDFATTVVPISLRGVINPREQNLWESFLNAFGLTTRRSTAAGTVTELAQNFKKAHNIQTEPGEFIYDPEKDPYRPIKQAATFSSVDAVAKEIEKAIAAGHPPAAIWKHFISYSNLPFTGSRKNDRLFYQELSDDNKKIYDDALRERRQQQDKFIAAWKMVAGHKTPTGQVINRGGNDYQVVGFDTDNTPMVQRVAE